MAKQSGDAGLITPAGYKLPAGSPPGLLAFMVSTGGNESGYNYFRPGGSPFGTVYKGDPSQYFADNGIPSDLQSMGYYQFQTGTDMFSAAQAANWDPKAQDKIAAQQMTAYYDQYGSWQAVSEAWGGGPGAVGNPSVGAVDWSQYQAPALAGHVNLPSQIQYGGYPGLTTAQLQQELAGHPYTGPIPAGSSTGGAASSGSTPAGGGQQPAQPGAAKPWGGAFGSQIEEAVFFLLGAALVIVGLVITFKNAGGGDDGQPTIIDRVGHDTEDAGVAAAAA